MNPSENRDQEQRRILDMLASDQINPEEAQRLLNAMNQNESSTRECVPSANRGTGWKKLAGYFIILIVSFFVIIPIMFTLWSIFIPRYGSYTQTTTAATTVPAQISYNQPVQGQGVISCFIFPLLIIPVVLLTIFWLWMLIDSLTRPAASYARAAPLTPNGQYDKIIWALIIFFSHFLGTLIYYFVIYRPERNRPSIYGI